MQWGLGRNLLIIKARSLDNGYFYASHSQVRPKHHVISEGIDASLNQKYIEASLPIQRKEVEEFFGLEGFQCECYAWAELGGTVRSDRALVKTACKYSSDEFLTAVEAGRDS